MKTKLVTLALLLTGAVGFAQSADEAVKKACAAETANFDKRDLTAVVAGYADVPYASRYWPNNAHNGATAIRAAYTTYVASAPQPTPMTREQSNWQLRPLGETYYWATYDQASTGADGKKSHSKEVRLLEKIGGQWKMVSVVTLPMPAPE
ncbi:MAG: hypothetical protein H7Z72_21085 [Bacteroidetes bacterium]|nr:hypothetical protein [Fibrella sp.]